MKIILTGGHHSSALPVISELKKRAPDAKLYWFGHRHSLKNDKNETLEYKEITALGLPFYELKAGKVYKTYDLARLILVPFGFIQAFWLLLKIRPTAILSFGGYLAVPVVIAGWLLGIPSVTHEQTVVAGYANKVIAFFAKKILISWHASAQFFPKSKTVFTGIPLRTEISEVKSTSFETKNSLPTIYITAGKSGAHKINTVLKEVLPELLKFCNIIHQSGDYSLFTDYADLAEQYAKIQPLPQGKFFLKKFVLEDEIGEAFFRATLVVARSGAHTISELLYLQKPALLIPIPWVSHDEQNKNALMLQKYGLAKILSEADLSPAQLIVSLKTMLSDITTYQVNVDPSTIIVKDAAKLICYEILNVTFNK